MLNSLCIFHLVPSVRLLLLLCTIYREGNRGLQSWYDLSTVTQPSIHWRARMKFRPTPAILCSHDSSLLLPIILDSLLYAELKSRGVIYLTCIQPRIMFAGLGEPGLHFPFKCKESFVTLHILLVSWLALVSYSYILICDNLIYCLHKITYPLFKFLNIWKGKR